MNGKRKTLPAEARIAFGFQRLTVPGPEQITPRWHQTPQLIEGWSQGCRDPERLRGLRGHELILASRALGFSPSGLNRLKLGRSGTKRNRRRTNEGGDRLRSVGGHGGIVGLLPGAARTSTGRAEERQGIEEPLTADGYEYGNYIQRCLRAPLMRRCNALLERP